MKRFFILLLLFAVLMLPFLGIAQTRTLPGTTIFPDLPAKATLKTDVSGKLVADTTKLATAKALIDSSVGLRTALNLKPNFRNTGLTWFTSENSALVLSGKTELQLRTATDGTMVAAKFGSAGNIEFAAGYFVHSGYGNGITYYHEPERNAGSVYDSYFNAAGDVVEHPYGNYQVSSGGSVTFNTGIGQSVRFLTAYADKVAINRDGYSLKVYGPMIATGGLVLIDTATGAQYILNVTNGQLTITPNDFADP